MPWHPTHTFRTGRGVLYEFLRWNLVIERSSIVADVYVANPDEGTAPSGYQEVYAVSPGMITHEGEFKYVVVVIVNSYGIDSAFITIYDFYPERETGSSRWVSVFSGFLPYRVGLFSVKADRKNVWVLIEKINGAPSYVSAPYAAELWRYDLVCHEFELVSTIPQIILDDSNVIEFQPNVRPLALVGNKIATACSTPLYDGDAFVSGGRWPYRAFTTTIQRNAEECA